MNTPTTTEEWQSWFDATFPLGAKVNVAAYGDEIGDDDVAYDEVPRLLALDRPDVGTALIAWGVVLQNPRYLFPVSVEHDPRDGTYLLTGRNNAGDSQWLLAPVREQEAKTLERIQEGADMPQTTHAYYEEILS